LPLCRALDASRRSDEIKVRLAFCPTDLLNSLLPARCITADNYHMNAKLGHLLAAARPMPLVPPVINAVTEIPTHFVSF